MLGNEALSGINLLLICSLLDRAYRFFLWALQGHDSERADPGGGRAWQRGTRDAEAIS